MRNTNHSEPLAQSVEQQATHPPNKLRVTPKHITSSNQLVDAGVHLNNAQTPLETLTIVSH